MQTRALRFPSLTSWAGLSMILTAGLLPAADSISGIWKILVAQDGSQRDYYLELKQDGGKVAGIFRSPRSGEYAFDGGTFDGKKFRIDVSRKLGETTSVYAIDAEAAAPDKLEGKLLIDGKETGTVVVTRQGSIVQGRWKVTTKTPEGREYESHLNLLEEDGVLKGKSTSRIGVIDLQGASFEKDTLKFEIVLPMRGTEVPLVLEATLKDANALEGRWKAKETEVSGDWIATRTLEAAVPAAAPAGPQPPPDAKLAGKWYGIVTRPDQGDQAFEMEVAVEGEKASARFRLGDVDFEVQDFRAAGSRLQGVVQFRDRGLEVRLTVEGALEGDALRGKWTAETGESGEWSAKEPITL